MDSLYYFQREQKQNQYGIIFHMSLDPQDATDRINQKLLLQLGR